MAIQDIASDLKPVVESIAIISADGTTNGNAVDTAGYECGIMFTAQCVNYTDGTYVVTLQESSDNVTFTNVPDEKIIGSIAAIEALSAEGETLGKLGVFSNKRYVRSVITASDVTTGGAVAITAILRGELRPV